MELCTNHMPMQQKHLITNDRVARTAVEKGIDATALNPSFLRMPVSASTTTKAARSNAGWALEGGAIYTCSGSGSQCRFKNTGACARKVACIFTRAFVYGLDLILSHISPPTLLLGVKKARADMPSCARAALSSSIFDRRSATMTMKGTKPIATVKSYAGMCTIASVGAQGCGCPAATTSHKQEISGVHVSSGFNGSIWQEHAGRATTSTTRTPSVRVRCSHFTDDQDHWLVLF